MVIQTKQGDMVLEIGPGVMRHPCATIAIDKNPLAQCDIVRDVAHRGIPFTEGTFDIVMCFDVIEHIERYEDLIFMINEIWRVLKPGGMWYFTTPDGVEGLQHFTHHRFFFRNGFNYLGKPPDKTWENMRKADGIDALFEIDFSSEVPRVLEGRFKAIK